MQEIIPQAILIDQASEVHSIDPMEIAQAWAIPHIPIIVCPLPGEEPLRQRLEVQGYLIKPVSRASLFDAMRPLGESVNRILIVDDDPDFVRLISQMLDSHTRRYQVTGAYSGREGLEKLGRIRPHLLLLDLVLPDMDGLQVVEQMHRNPKWRPSPSS